MTGEPETDGGIPYLIRSLIEDHEGVSRSREGFASLLFDTLIHKWGQYELHQVMDLMPDYARPLIVEYAADLKARNFHYGYVTFGSQPISDEKMAAFEQKKRKFADAVAAWALAHPNM